MSIIRKLGLTGLVVAIIAISVRGSELKLFTSEAGRFSVMMPGAPTDHARTVKLPDPIGEITLHQFLVEEGEIVCMVQYSDYPDVVVQTGKADVILDGACSGMITAMNATVIGKETISQAGYPGREVDFMVQLPGKSNLGFGRSRFYLLDNRLYAVMFIRSASSIQTDQFLNSFKFHK